VDGKEKFERVGNTETPHKLDVVSTTAAARLAPGAAPPAASLANPAPRQTKRQEGSRAAQDALELSPDLLRDLLHAPNQKNAFKDVALRQMEIQETKWAALEAHQERVSATHERISAAHERMLPANERIAEHQRIVAEARLELWKAQEPQRVAMNEIYLKAVGKEQDRIDDTFETMFRQTKSAGHMFWMTFLLGAFLVVASVCAFFVRPDANNQLIAAFFGAGALSMLAFFLRDPADKVQQAGGKLVQLQVAMRYHLIETQYWGTYFSAKVGAGKEVTARELAGSLSSMRDGMRAIMRQIDESLGNQPEKTGFARWCPKILASAGTKRGGPPGER